MHGGKLKMKTPSMLAIANIVYFAFKKVVLNDPVNGHNVIICAYCTYIALVRVVLFCCYSVFYKLK